jgi:hypothetical protein
MNKLCVMVAMAMAVSACSESPRPGQISDLLPAVQVPPPPLEKAPAPQPGEAQFAQVNPVLRAIVDAILREDDFYRSVEVSFDQEYSNLSFGQLKYDLSAEIRDSAWAPGEASRFGSSTWFKATRDAAAGTQGIRTGTEFTLVTQLLPFLRHAGAKGLEDARKNASGPYRARGLELLDRLSRVRDLEAFNAVLRDGRGLGIDAANAELAKVRERLACFESGQCPAYPLQGETPEQAKKREVERRSRLYRNFRTLVEELGRVRLHAFLSGGTVTGVAFSHPGTGFFEGEFDSNRPDAAPVSAVRQLRLDFSGNTIKVGLDAYFSLKEDDFLDLRKRLNDEYLKLGEGDPQTRADFESSYRRSLKDLKKSILEARKN